MKRLFSKLRDELARFAGDETGRGALGTSDPLLQRLIDDAPEWRERVVQRSEAFRCTSPLPRTSPARRTARGVAALAVAASIATAAYLGWQAFRPRHPMEEVGIAIEALVQGSDAKQPSELAAAVASLRDWRLRTLRATDPGVLLPLLSEEELALLATRPLTNASRIYGEALGTLGVELHAECRQLVGNFRAGVQQWSELYADRL
ncbi:MAG: hypothetical protein KDA61_19625 [Planctomycetales bacterium]|nr:hypothetical protein [Planctomycetales bacterium]